MRLEGKTAIVTGGSSGFGAGIVRKFHAEGARVLIADLNAEMGQELASELGEGVEVIRVNVADGDDVVQMAQQAMTLWGQIDVLVNNAGVTHLPAAMEDISEEDFDRVIVVNVKSVFLAAKTIVPLMKARGAGAILNVASTAGVSPRPRLSWYNASKGLSLIHI